MAGSALEHGCRRGAVGQIGFSRLGSAKITWEVIAASTITNYTCNITKPPLEAPYQAHAWAG
jgi:hypothetical protein